MIANLSKSLIVLALVLSTGLHWAALQTVAWGTMLTANLSSQQSVTEAVSQTFDGEHPCPLCKAIAAGKKSEKQSDQLTLKLKLEFTPDAEQMVLVAPQDFSLVGSEHFVAEALASQPLLTPPRAA
jgi:hypothetical protein